MTRIRVEYILYFMEENNLSKKQFADLAGISISTLSRILTGKPIRIRIPTLLDIAKALDIFVVQLLDMD